MATLINGNGNPRIYAAQDADLIAALAGDITGIAQIGNKFAATAVDANTISVADGVIVTKEGRRIQLDAGSTDMFVIPTGTTGVTNYYIIGYKLTTQSDDSQIAETFVQLMSSSSETITEDTFREGATDVYVSLYRVQQNGVNLGTITGLLPELTNISELKSDLNSYKTRPANTLLWQGSISDGEILQFDPGDTSRFKALSFKLFYSPLNQLASCIMPIECFQTSNVILSFVMVTSVYIIRFIPTDIKNGATLGMYRVLNGSTESETGIKLVEVYGILK